MKQNKRIAITGGMGSGKSTVARFIADLGYTVISCDEVYSELLQDKSFTALIGHEFSGVLEDDGSLNRAKLSRIVFNGGEGELKKLNALTHPVIIAHALQKTEDEKLCFIEVPLLFEGGYERLFDGVIVVLRDLNERISSVVERNKIRAEEALLRIKRQINYENLDFTKYYVIHNSSNLAHLKQKTLEIVNILIND